MKVLVVEDDRKIKAEAIDDSLASLGHESDWAQNQQEANALLAAHDYDLILLDLQIPARPGGQALAEFGKNLLRQIRDRLGQTVPVILMTAQYQRCVELMTTLQEIGIDGSLAKPFASTGRTLAVVMAEVLDKHRRRPGGRGPVRTELTQPFESGAMVFYPDRVELCGVKVCGGRESGLIRDILEQLRRRNSQGRSVRYAGAEMAELLGCPRGQNGIAEAVRAFRGQVCAALLEEANIKVDRLHDIILNDRRYGYRLAAKITACDGFDGANEPQSGITGCGQGDVVNDNRNVEEDAVTNARQRWALDAMQAGDEVRKADIVTRFGCSNTTAERDLRNLRHCGLIEFVGPARTGYWRPLAARV